MFNSFSANSTKWPNTLKQFFGNCLSVFDHFVGLALKGLKVWFESCRHFCSITESGSFIKQLSRNKVPNNEFLKSVWKKSSLWLVQKKNRPEKCTFIATNNWIVLAVWWSVKYFYAPNSLIFRKNAAEGGMPFASGHLQLFAIPKRYVLQAKNILNNAKNILNQRQSSIHHLALFILENEFPELLCNNLKLNK